MAATPSDTKTFFEIAKYCFDLWKRIKALDDEHVHFKAQAAMLSLVFGQLHRTLLRFQDIPEDTAEMFTTLRVSCYLTLKQMEPMLDQFKKLSEASKWGKRTRRVRMAVENSYEGLRQKLEEQTKLLASVVTLLEMAANEFNRERAHSQQMKENRMFHAQMLRENRMLRQKFNELSNKIDEARGLSQGGRITQFDPRVMRQASIAMQQDAPPELAEDIRATFRLGHKSSPLELMNGPLIPPDAITKKVTKTSSPNEYHSDFINDGYAGTAYDRYSAYQHDSSADEEAQIDSNQEDCENDSVSELSDSEGDRSDSRFSGPGDDTIASTNSSSEARMSAEERKRAIERLERRVGVHQERDGIFNGGNLGTAVGVVATIGAAAWAVGRRMLG
ncbi:hypothetical protein B0H63DRAFT_480767 [Podospora didyma]|uniref:Uncharacterized protein n=1 Tax=Podospora didyma TaxID=330526 RepID=A0AAE0KEH0_9PEZI|nr:hypothetical protein B0H63DRAFT_480767 [Podospora didyma]